MLCCIQVLKAKLWYVHLTSFFIGYVEILTADCSRPLFSTTWRSTQREDHGTCGPFFVMSLPSFDHIYISVAAYSVLILLKTS